MTDPTGGTLTLEETTTKVVEPGDHDTFSHYVRKADKLAAMVDGIPIQALCGKMWLPVKNPADYPVCPDCQAIMDDVVASNHPHDPNDQPSDS